MKKEVTGTMRRQAGTEEDRTRCEECDETRCEEYDDEAVSAFREFRETVARLRAPDGCPWDRAQTHESLKPECVEEAAEVVCGINILTKTGRPDSLIEELGDLLMQVVMHAQIAEEEGLFTMADVLHCVNEKMIRRHPHVFGEKSLEYIRKLAGPQAMTENPVGETHAKESAAEETHAKESAAEESPAGKSPVEKSASEKSSVEISSMEKSSLEYTSPEAPIPADWKYIKSLEKKGREWEEKYLFEAFDEAGDLIGQARTRKLRER